MRIGVVLVIWCALAAGSACQRKKRGLEVDTREAAPLVDAAPAPTPFPRLLARDLTALRIERAGQPAVVLRRESGGWMLVEPEHAIADERAVSFALREIERLEWDPAPVATSRDAWPDLAVTDDQVVVLRVEAGGRALPPLHVGPRRHVRIGDAPAVWKLHHLDHFTFARELRLWRDRTVLRVDPAHITGVEIGDRRVRRQAGDDLKRVVQEIEAREQAAIDPRAAGLAPPRLTVLVRRGEQPTVELHIGRRESQTTYMRVAGDERIWKVDNQIADLVSMR